MKPRPGHGAATGESCVGTGFPRLYTGRPKEPVTGPTATGRPDATGTRHGNLQEHRRRRSEVTGADPAPIETGDLSVTQDEPALAPCGPSELAPRMVRNVGADRRGVLSDRGRARRPFGSHGTADDAASPRHRFNFQTIPSPSGGTGKGTEALSGTIEPEGRRIMDEIEGAIHITRLDRETAPEPWVYDITFAPYAGPGGALTVRKVTGDDQLRKLLRDGVGVRQPFLDDALKQARFGSAAIPRVRLTAEQTRSLRL
jgi:hypothetical protein